MSATDTVYGMLSVLFAAVAVRELRQAVRSRCPGWRLCVDHLLHAAMATAMAAMPWSWGRGLLEPPQVVFFAAAALWFPLSEAAGRRPFRPGAIAGRLPPAAGMAAMAWMTHTMTASSYGTPAGGVPAVHHAAHPGHLAGKSAAGEGVVAALALFLLAYALWLLTRDMPGLRGAEPTSHGTGASAMRQIYARFWEGSMALGTFVMLLMPH
ncbi:DUF5134 domain-containing protein [Streptomyces sp. CB02400]|uniref:DUF5134 domain-containing protein n=1 Tax=Streptomyces sp. CB02400 TaxID=1703944 RepID=UPI00093C680D|nr:DUF5134 domain-containing protein [Streptomyces sp. CB02400]OKK05053.1 hypothetical protein AMK33_22905 [Streptomyces sp. CB02400]